MTIAWEYWMMAVLKPAVVFLAVLCAMRIFELTVLRWLFTFTARLRRKLFHSFIKALGGSWLFLSLLLAAYAAFKMSFFRWGVEEMIKSIFIVLFVFYFTWVLHRLITYQTDSLIADQKDKRRSVTSLKFFNRICDIFIWIGALFIVVSVLEYDITVLLAGLGVGGVLFAVASQKILSEMFSSFAIYSDHVFEEGDFIIIGDFRGNPGHARGRIERIGLRSTHLRAPAGESIILPNQDLASKIIYNYSKKKETRMSLVFSLGYEADSGQLSRLNDLVQEILKKQELVRAGRVNFQEFGSSGLVFELIYELETADYDEMQAVYQEIALALKERLADEGIKIMGG